MNIETVKCDNIPLPISRIGLGTWAIGGWMWGGSDEAESIKTIQHAVDLGINLIDTAPVYGFGHSEEIVGKALADGGRRDKAVLATKVALVDLAMNNTSERAVTQDALKETSGKPENKIKKGVKFLSCAGGALFIGVGILGIQSRNAWTREVQQLTDKAARTIVHVVHPSRAIEAISLQLPGQTMPYTDTPIYAQTSGYLKKWYFDIGSEVKAGAVLAEIDTPEVDAQLAQAQAQLKVAEATRDLSKVTYQRYQELLRTNVIAPQDFDTAADNYGQDQGTVIADQANVNRLDALEAFKIVRAPFDGIVTARNTDIGAFIPLGSGTQLFRLARISPLRVYVDVPEAFTEFVKVGADAELTAGPVAGRKFPARVVGTAGAINPTAKRLLAELEVPNQTGQLFPGAYVQVTLQIEGNKGDLTIPAGTLLFTSGKPAVGVVRPNGTVEIRKISINRDLGSTLEISQGLSESDQVIISPPLGLVNGAVVIIANPT
jgi:RND family efflux transporter MFP subunit